ncbi:MAG: sigma-70 family RNA polymerase sigma factor [Gammaproteobacteria bacterium]
MTHSLSEPGEWLERYGNILYRFAYARVRDREVAEDLLQETLLAALKAKDNFAGQAAEQTWLIGILKHKMMDYFRQAARDNMQELQEQSSGSEEDDYFDRHGHWQIALGSWSKPDKSLEQEQFFAVLQHCVERLPPRMAQLFVLRELDGLESEEICTLLSISTLNNFWVTLSRARMQLRHCLDVQWFNKSGN